MECVPDITMAKRAADNYLTDRNFDDDDDDNDAAEEVCVELWQLWALRSSE